MYQDQIQKYEPKISSNSSKPRPRPQKSGLKARTHKTMYQNAPAFFKQIKIRSLKLTFQNNELTKTLPTGQKHLLPVENCLQVSEQLPLSIRQRSTSAKIKSNNIFLIACNVSA